MSVYKVLIVDRVTGDVIAQDDITPITNVDVQVGSSYGEPTATAVYEDGVLAISFANLKGNGITNIVKTESSTAYDGVNTWQITEDNGEITEISVRNGSKGLQGEKGDTVILGDEQTYTLYSIVGSNTDGAMTQKAASDAIGTMMTQDEYDATTKEAGVKYIIVENLTPVSLSLGNSNNTEDI